MSTIWRSDDAVRLERREDDVSCALTLFVVENKLFCSSADSFTYVFVVMRHVNLLLQAPTIKIDVMMLRVCHSRTPTAFLWGLGSSQKPLVSSPRPNTCYAHFLAALHYAVDAACQTRNLLYVALTSNVKRMEAACSYSLDVKVRLLGLFHRRRKN